MPTATLTPTRATGAAVDPLVVAAEGLIVRGKEHGEIPADDIIAAFPDLELEPDALERLFDSFRQMGIAIAGEADASADEEEDTPALVDVSTAVSLDDPVRMYLREIGEVALLTKEQEVLYAQRIEAGDDDAKHLLAAANLRLVVSIAQ